MSRLIKLSEIREVKIKADELREEARVVLHKFLTRECGWEYTCQTPGCHWLYKKTFDGVGALLVNMETALDSECERAEDDLPEDY